MDLLANIKSSNNPLWIFGFTFLLFSPGLWFFFQLGHRRSFKATGVVNRPTSSLFQWLVVEPLAQTLAAVISHAAVQQALAHVLVLGMNQFLMQQQLHVPVRQATETLAQHQKEMARSAGEEFPQLIGQFFQGLWQGKPNSDTTRGIAASSSNHLTPQRRTLKDSYLSQPDPKSSSNTFAFATVPEDASFQHENSKMTTTIAGEQPPATPSRQHCAPQAEEAITAAVPTPPQQATTTPVQGNQRPSARLGILERVVLGSVVTNTNAAQPNKMKTIEHNQD